MIVTEPSTTVAADANRAAVANRAAEANRATGTAGLAGLVDTRPATVGALVRAHGHEMRLPAGAPIFFEGDDSHSVYVCVTGRIRVFVTLPSGRDLLIGMKEPGEEFGELSALDQRPRAASATALEDSVVAHMPGDRFLDELRHEPELALAVLRSLADQLRRNNARLRARSGDSAFVRTGQLLIELSSLKMRHDRRAARIEIPLSQDEIAEWIGTTRESAARALGRLRRAGLIGTGRCRVTVHDLPGLVAAVRAH